MSLVASPTLRPPVIILVEPQLGENIGAAARAMLNCGLSALRLVAPRDGWPSAPARANAAGADLVIDQAEVFATLDEAVADLRYLIATTARHRELAKPVLDPEPAAAALHAAAGRGAPAGILFGRERSGLTNDEVALADAILNIPLNPAFASLNLAQAVLLVGWEWRRAGGLATAAAGQVAPHDAGIEPRATGVEMAHLFAHLEDELDRGGFFFPPEKRPIMLRNLRTLIMRAQPSSNDVATIHGIIRSLTGRRQRG